MARWPKGPRQWRRGTSSVGTPSSGLACLAAKRSPLVGCCQRPDRRQGVQCRSGGVAHGVGVWVAVGLEPHHNRHELTFIRVDEALPATRNCQCRRAPARRLTPRMTSKTTTRWDAAAQRRTAALVAGPGRSPDQRPGQARSRTADHHRQGPSTAEVHRRRRCARLGRAHGRERPARRHRRSPRSVTYLTFTDADELSPNRWIARAQRRATVRARPWRRSRDVVMFAR